MPVLIAAGRIGSATQCLIFKQAVESGLAWSLSAISLMCLFPVQEMAVTAAFTG